MRPSEHGQKAAARNDTQPDGWCRTSTLLRPRTASAKSSGQICAQSGVSTGHAHITCHTRYIVAYDSVELVGQALWSHITSETVDTHVNTLPARFTANTAQPGQTRPPTGEQVVAPRSAGATHNRNTRSTRGIGARVRRIHDHLVVQPVVAGHFAGAAWCGCRRRHPDHVRARHATQVAGALLLLSCSQGAATLLSGAKFVLRSRREACQEAQHWKQQAAAAAARSLRHHGHAELLNEDNYHQVINVSSPQKLNTGACNDHTQPVHQRVHRDHFDARC